MTRQHTSRSVIVSALLGGTMMVLFSNQAMSAGALKIDEIIDRVKTLLDKGDNAGARPMLDDYLKVHPDDVKALCYRALVCNPLDFKQCEKDFSRALSLSGGDQKKLPLQLSTIYIVRAYANSRLGRKQQAFADIESARKRAPDTGEVYHIRGTIERTFGMTREAMADFERGARLDPKHQLCIENALDCARVLQLRDKEKLWRDKLIELHPTLEQVISQAKLMTDSGKHSEALVYVKKAVEIAAADEDVRAYEVETLIQLSRQKEALAACQRALAVLPKSLRLMRWRANLLHQLKQDDRSIAAYKAVLKLYPGDIEALEELAVVLRMNNRYEEAIQHFERAARIGQPKTDVLRVRAESYRRAQMFKEAARDYHSMYRRTLDRGYAIDEADCFLAMNQYEKAIFAIDTACDTRAKAAPLSRARQVHAHGTKGHALLRLRKYASAIDEADAALKVDPNNFAVSLLRAEARSAVGDIDGAIVDFSRAIKLRPDFATGYAERARLYDRKKNFRLAERDRQMHARLSRSVEKDFFPTK